MYIRGLVVVALLVSLCRATVWLHEDFEQWPAAHGSPWRLVESRSKAAAFFQQQRIERFSNDTGSLLSNSMLVAPSKAKFYGAYRMLERSVPFIVSEPLVLQFDAFLPEELNCAGGYIKLVSAANVSHWDYEVPKQSRWWPKRVPFAVLFGPDMCGKSIKHVRLVLQVYRPDLRIWEEWHLLRAPSLEQVPRGVTSRFYLSVTTDYSFEIRVNYNSVYNGTLNVRARYTLPLPHDRLRHRRSFIFTGWLVGGTERALCAAEGDCYRSRLEAVDDTARPAARAHVRSFVAATSGALCRRSRGCCGGGGSRDSHTHMISHARPASCSIFGRCTPTFASTMCSWRHRKTSWHRSRRARSCASGFAPSCSTTRHSDSNLPRHSPAYGSRCSSSCGTTGCSC